MTASPNNRAELWRLLQARSKRPELAGEIDLEIHARFDRHCAILVLDLSGFTRLSLRYGIISFLALVHRMRELAEPRVLARSGRVVMQAADNLMAVFTDVAPAVQSALDILGAMREANRTQPELQEMHASIGIGYGTVLAVGEDDLYGNEVNLACKLGEDLARPGEVLLTESAWTRVVDHGLNARMLPLSISGVQLNAWQVVIEPAQSA